MTRVYYLLLLLCFTRLGFTQLTGFQVPKGKEKIEIPFQFENNFILIKVVFNRVFPLTFILDTGSENTILAKKAFADLMNVQYDREYKVYGADMSTELTVHLARSVSLDLPTIGAKIVPILVLEDDYFHFEKYTGLKIHGILGMDLFKLTTLQIDYNKKILTLYPPDNFKPKSNKFTSFPVEIYRNKFYLTIQGAVNNSAPATPLKLLLDTGANLALLLHNDSDSTIALPSKLIPGKLGDGLGGFLEGYMGRSHSLAIGDYTFSSIVTHFQKIPPSIDSLPLNQRNGILGNGILSRFTVIIAPFDNKLYLKPKKKYNKGFKFDKSGITLIASGLSLEHFTVIDVVPNSPADLAGIQVEDQILNINFLPARFYDMTSLTNKFQGRTGKLFRLMLKRNGQKKKVVFRLKDLI